MRSKYYEELCKRVEKIDKNAAEYMRGDARKLVSFMETDDILRCFAWKDTIQGFDYWFNICNKLNNRTSLNFEIKKHKARLGMSQSELSKAIGKSKNYLSEMINRGCSKEKEQEIIALLNDLKSDYEIIAELSQRLADLQDECAALRAENDAIDKTTVMMSLYFISAMFVGVFIGAFWL